MLSLKSGFNDEWPNHVRAPDYTPPPLYYLPQALAPNLI